MKDKRQFTEAEMRAIVEFLGLCASGEDVSITYENMHGSLADAVALSVPDVEEAFHIRVNGPDESTVDLLSRLALRLLPVAATRQKHRHDEVSLLRALTDPDPARYKP